MTGGRRPANPYARLVITLAFPLKPSTTPDSRPVTIQVLLPVLGVVHGVREAFHGLCIATGLQVLEAMMEADRAGGEHTGTLWV